MKKLHLFEADDSLVTYTYPIVKIVVCTAIIPLLIYRDHFLHIDQQILEKIVSVLAVALGGACLFCIAISWAEISMVSDNRSEINQKMNENTKECLYLSVDKVISLISQNDIIDLKIVSTNAYYHVGASSDSKPGSSVFFDKTYYIKNGKIDKKKTLKEELSEFNNIESFREELMKYAVDEQILVATIDDVLPKHYKL